MKGSERHHLKENEISQVLASATVRLQQHRGTITLVAGILLLVLVAGGGYWAWKARAENRAQMVLGDAIVIVQTPVQEPGAKPEPGAYPTVQARTEAALAKFSEVFNAYPSTDAGIAARYYAAGALATLGRYPEAATRYQEVVDRAGANSFYGRMGQMGVVEANAQARQYDQAISAAQALVNNAADDTMPRDALLIQLGRVQAAAGKKAEARQTLDKMIADFPESPFVDEAKRMITELT